MTRDGPLAGVSVLVTRAPEQAGELSAQIRALGGEPVEAPTIVIRPGDRTALLDALRQVAAQRFIAVCFTSPNGVSAVAAVVEEARLGRGFLAGVRVAAVGPATAAALREQLGIEPDLVPDTSTTDALGEAFAAGTGRVLLPRADIASDTLPRVLSARGYEPVTVDAYTTAPPERLTPGVADRLAADIDLLAFTSSSTVRNFVRLVGDLPWRGRVVTIGPVTSTTCRELGIEVAEEAARHDLDGLVEALIRAAATVRSSRSGPADGPSGAAGRRGVRGR
ncbi:MAG: uroporphyrinogen-III synthase [Actinomycetota bacterium]|nr:uroporphyrinogen-III synthase [Actinomycetota bacterium]